MTEYARVGPIIPAQLTTTIRPENWPKNKPIQKERKVSIQSLRDAFTSDTFKNFRGKRAKMLVIFNAVESFSSGCGESI